MLKLHTLGSLAVHGPDGPLSGAVAQPRRLAVLVLIARGGGRGTPRPKVLTMLWPDADDVQGRRAISQALYALRRDLGDDEAIVGTHVLRLNENLAWCDVTEFDAALARGEHARAVELYGGPFLEGFRLPDSPEFERWADEERTAVEHRFHGALEELATRADERRDFADAARWWRRRAACDPLNGRVALATMRSLSAAGERAAALRHAGVFEALVAEELELPADRDVVALAEALRREAAVASAAPARGEDDRVSRPRAVAVLPFVHLGKSPDPDADASWSHGLGEEMIHALLGLPGLKVVARSASFALGESPSLAALRELNLSHVVEGSIRGTTAGLRITVRIADASDGHAIWWDRVDCARAAAGDVYDAIVERVVGQMRGMVAGEGNR